MAIASTVLADSTELVRAGWTVGITVLVLFVLVIAIGFTVLFRRRGAAASGGAGTPDTRANILLVRVDDAVKNSTDELGFAIAQFGEEKTREFSTALAAAKARLTEAFALRQQLDDSAPDTATQRREWTARIISLCESAQASLDAQGQKFASLRRLEKDAPANLDAVRELIASTSARLPASATTLASLDSRYAPDVLATVRDGVGQAETLLASATKTADTALAGTGPAADAIQSAERDATRATQALDAIDRLAAALAAASTRLEALASDARAAVAEARSVRDAPPDPQTGAAVAGVEQVLAKLGSPAAAADPAGGIRALDDAMATLDTSLGSARNQTQRLEHARTALTGALLTAHSQISTTTDFIGGRPGGIGAEARTRLAEAQRLLTIAEAEADPVIALDTARSSATYSRDADALARYDAIGR